MWNNEMTCCARCRARGLGARSHGSCYLLRHFGRRDEHSGDRARSRDLVGGAGRAAMILPCEGRWSAPPSAPADPARPAYPWSTWQRSCRASADCPRALPALDPAREGPLRPPQPQRCEIPTTRAAMPLSRIMGEPPGLQGMRSAHTHVAGGGRRDSHAGGTPWIFMLALRNAFLIEHSAITLTDQRNPYKLLSGLMTTQDSFKGV
jgi:hypothetical protein